MLSPLERARLAQELAAKVQALQAVVPSMDKTRLAIEASALSAQLAATAMPAEVIELTSKELGEFPDTPEGKKALRSAAMAAFAEIIGEWIPCRALGTSVELRKTGLNKVKSLSADPRKLMIIPRIRELIKSAAKVGYTDNYDKANSPNIAGYYTLRSPVSLADQKLAVRFVVGLDDKGAYHYDHAIVQSDAILDGANKNGPAEASPSVLMGRNRGFMSSRSTALEPTCLLLAEPSAGHQDNRIFDQAGKNVNTLEVLNLFIEGDGFQAPVDNGPLGQEKSPDWSGLDSATTSNAGGVAEKSVKPIRLAGCQLGSILDAHAECVNSRASALDSAADNEMVHNLFIERCIEAKDAANNPGDGRGATMDTAPGIKDDTAGLDSATS